VELATGKLLRRFDAHYHLNPQASGVGKVNAVRFSPDGRHVASGGTDRKVLVWEPDTGKVVRELGQETFVETLAFLPKSDRLLVGGGSGKIGLWNAATGQLDRTYDTEMTGVHGLAVTADGRRALAVGFLREPNGKIHTVLRVWDLESGKEVLQKRLPSRSDNRQAAMSADGRFVLADDPVDPYSVVLWEIESGKKVRSFLQREGTVFSVAISPEGRRLLVGGGGIMELFEMDSGKHLASFTGHGGPFRAITFSPDGQFAVSANSTRVFLWRLP